MDIQQVKKNLKSGWMLNPNEKVVNSILKGIKRCDGECPCVNDSEDKHCPCSNYREHDKCCCSLYVKKSEYFISQLKRGKRVYVQDYHHILSFDLFQNVTIVSITQDEPIRLATVTDFDKCFMHNNN